MTGQQHAVTPNILLL